MNISAWNMFKNLESENAYKFHKALFKILFPDLMVGNPDSKDIHDKLCGELLWHSEEEAIKIMEKAWKTY